MSDANSTRANKLNALCKAFKPSVIATILLACSITQAGTWQMKNKAFLDEDHRAFCTKIFEHLKTVSSDRCWADAMETYPEFFDPPWQDLDPKEHIDLIARLLLYAQVGARFYFSEPNWQPDSSYLYKTKLFIENGGSLQVWHTRLMSFYDSENKHPVPQGELSVVLLTNGKYKTIESTDDCPAKPSKGWGRRAYIVLPDLSGPDPQVDAGIASVLYSMWPVLYRGQTYLIRHEDVWRDLTTTGLKPICDYNFTESEPSSKHQTHQRKDK